MNEIILIYGSYAKNEMHKHSDIDVLIVTDSKIVNEKHLETLKKSKIDLDKIDVRILSFNSFIWLVKINSLYIHHIKDCNMIIKGEKLFYLLTKGLNDYEITEQDVEKLLKLAEDCLSSIKYNGANIFDLSVLFTFLRNALILINYKQKRLIFNKLKLIEVYENEISQNNNLRTAYMICYDAKIKMQRGYADNAISVRWSPQVEKEIKKFMTYFSERKWL